MLLDELLDDDGGITLLELELELLDGWVSTLGVGSPTEFKLAFDVTSEAVASSMPSSADGSSWRSRSLGPMRIATA